MSKRKKIYVLDTNVLLHDVNSINSFEEHEVVIPMIVIEELDNIKNKEKSDEIKRNGRIISRMLDVLRGQGNITKGVSLPNGGTIRIEDNCQTIPKGFYLPMKTPDNVILLTALNLKIKEREKEKKAESALRLRKSKEDKNSLKKTRVNKAREVVLVTKDINLRLKGDVFQIISEDYETGKVNADELYVGWRRGEVESGQLDELYKNGKVVINNINLLSNEFVLLSDIADQKRTALARNRNGSLKLVGKKEENVWRIRSRNKEQTMCLELLLDPNVELVTLVGKAGTGKTLLALAAGLESVITLKKYDKILVLRPIVALGKDIGYMPGDKDAKLSHWMQPIFDNLEFLMEKISLDGKEMNGEAKVRNLLNTGIVKLEAIAFARGRSIPRTYIIVDEAQNLTPHEATTIVTRAGIGTKIIFLGDPQQIDHPYLDSESNGLVYVVECMKNQTLYGHVKLTKPERSGLATIAAEIMK